MRKIIIASRDKQPKRLNDTSRDPFSRGGGKRKVKITLPTMKGHYDRSANDSDTGARGRAGKA